jgi:hypothetical protein
MATVTLNYETHNALIESIIQSAILAGASIVKEKPAKKKPTPFEESLEDIEYGRVTRVKNIDCVIEEILQ